MTHDYVFNPVTYYSSFFSIRTTSVLNTFTESHRMKQNQSTSSSSFGSAKKNISETLSWWHQRAQLMPNWIEFRYELPNAFLFNYLFAFAFLIIACISLLAMRTIRPHLALRRSLVTLNLFIFLMASVRAFCLFIDPYGSHQVIVNSTLCYYKL